MTDQKITPISASWDCNGQRSDAYRMLNMIHSMAGSLANLDKSFRLSRTCTEQNYVFTEWTNGIVDIGAETFKDHNGEPTSHEYYLRPVIQKEED